MSLVVSFGTAFFAGVLSFLSPCVLPLVPGYIGFLSGLGNSAHTDGVDRSDCGNTDGSRLNLILASALFVGGFLTVFVALGASTTLVGNIVARHLSLFQIIGGCLITILGVHFLGLVRIGFLNKDVRFMPSPRRLGVFGVYVVGLAFGFGWTPCVGPVLATILMLAAGAGGESGGAGLLLAYGLGLGLPFVMVAVFADLFIAKFRYFSAQMRYVKWILGGFLLLTGLAMMTGMLSTVGFWMLQAVPLFQEVG